MKRFVSLCLCGVMVLGLLSGCGEATIQKTAKDGVATVSDEVHKSFKDAISSRDDKTIKSATKSAINTAIMPQIKKMYNEYKKASEVLGNVEGQVMSDPYERAKAMFQQLEYADQNSLYSPLSLEMAIGLVSEGSSGITQSQIFSFLGTEDYAEVAKTVMARADEVTPDIPEEEGMDYGGYKTALKVANSLWVGKDYSLQESFLGVAKDAYRATSQSVDFSKSEEACAVINRWCDENTKGLIKEIVKPNMLSSTLAMILCNSVYFESPWFDKWDVDVGEFTNGDGRVVTVEDMLYSTEDVYYETDNAKAFGKRYVNGSMFIGILPDEGKSLADIDLKALVDSKTNSYKVRVSMPKLSYEFTCQQLIEALNHLGVVNAFTDQATFDGIVNEAETLNIDEIIQKCKIELDENGTKAAAVTAIMMEAMSALPDAPPEFREVHLNRPFYYMIVDEAMNQVLFIGAVNVIDGPVG